MGEWQTLCEPAVPRFFCPECPRMFGVAEALRDHLDYAHPFEGHLAKLDQVQRYSATHDCRSCGRSFVSKTGLAVHLRDQHQDELRSALACRRGCGQTFWSAKSRGQHERWSHAPVAVTA